MNFDKTINDNEVIRINVDYSKGSCGGRRGIFVSFDNFEIIYRGDWAIERGCPMDGMRVFCESMKRASAKTLKKWEEAVCANKERLFALWQANDRDGICAELGRICA